VYLSCGNALARPTNLPRSVSRSARNDALTAAADSLVMMSCARVGVAEASSAVASAETTAVRRNDITGSLRDFLRSAFAPSAFGVTGCASARQLRRLQPAELDGSMREPR